MTDGWIMDEFGDGSDLPDDFGAELEPDLSRQTQTIFHDDPEGRNGDCLRTAVACLIGRPLLEVPHFCQVEVDHDGLWWYAYVGYFASFQPAYKVNRLVVDPRNPVIPEEPCIVAGKSPRGDFNHVVVYFGDGEWWDPHPSQAGLDTVIEVETFEPFT